MFIIESVHNVVFLIKNVIILIQNEILGTCSLNMSSSEIWASKGSSSSSPSWEACNLCKRFWHGLCLIYIIWSSSAPSRLIDKAHTLNNFLMISAGNFFQASSNHSIICCLDGPLMFPWAVNSWSSLASQVSYISLRYSFVGLCKL